MSYCLVVSLPCCCVRLLLSLRFSLCNYLMSVLNPGRFRLSGEIVPAWLLVEVGWVYSSSVLRLPVLQLCLGLLCTLFSLLCLFFLCRFAGACVLSALGAWAGSSLCGASVCTLAPLVVWCAPVFLLFLPCSFLSFSLVAVLWFLFFSCRWFVLFLFSFSSLGL